ncbi:hypothetical protein B0H16DRAFT_1778975 [Mycena metata]|uniref:DUF6535 domain-containing protein n=1 Tax=Mycena metata TaxID=1033252 RepID=A0AAD7JQN1_9AGAR|nr:hypothetical protein B0H16DRAFT_1778975 [Mycena metata]
MSITDDPVAISQSDNDRLIAALQTCFVDLAKKQEQQGEKLYRAVEALKPQAPTTDKKTAFWNSYMKLADEHDKEFQEKYSTDLDTALIFSGLFSAVASAFVIQIEPQLTTDPPKIIVIVQCLLYASLFTTLLAALLAVLGKQWLMYYQAAGSRGTIDERGRERQRKFDGLVKWKFEAVLQAFPLLLQLALLLFASSISLYLWTIQHSVAILVTVLTALGLSSYVILLVSATIFSDCPFQSPLALILASWVDSLKWLLFHPRYTARQFLHRLSRLSTSTARYIRSTPRRLLQSFSSFGRSKIDLLPRFMSRILPSTKEPDPYAHYKSIEVSPEVPAVAWALTTSTDPAMITVAADLGADLQWPIQLDRSVQTIVKRLWITARDLCVDNSSRTVRPGMLHSVVVYGKLYCTLHVPRRYYKPAMSMTIRASNATDEPTAILQMQMRAYRDEVQINLPGNSAATVQWVLHIIPSFDIPSKDKIRYLARGFPMEAQADMQIFTNFLCCVGAAAVPAEPWLMRRVDKSGLCYLLMNRFFIALRHLAATDTEVTIKLLDIAAQLAVQLAPQFPLAKFEERVNLVREFSEFSNKFPRVEGWLEVMVMAAKLSRTDLTGLCSMYSWTRWERGHNPNPPLPSLDVQEMEWIHMALEHTQKSWQEGPDDAEDREWDSNTIRAIDGLLQALSCNDSLPDNPPISSLRIILRALSSTTDVAVAAFLVLARAKSWVLNPDFQPIMVQFSMWHHLGRVARCYKRENRWEEDVITDSYQELVQHAASRPEWKSTLFDDLPTCIAVFSDPSEWMWYGSEEHKAHRSDFISVLQNIWVPSFPQVDGQQQPIQFTNAGQQCTALCLVALSNIWESYNTAKSPLEQFLQLVRCTASTALVTRNPTLSPLEDFEPTFSSRLCGALAPAAVKARQSTQVGVLGGLDASPSHVDTRRMADLLDILTQKLEIEFSKPDRRGRDTLRDELDAEIDAWEESLAQQNAQETARAEALVAQPDAEEVGEGAHIAVTVD